MPRLRNPHVKPRTVPLRLVRGTVHASAVPELSPCAGSVPPRLGPLPAGFPARLRALPHGVGLPVPLGLACGAGRLGSARLSASFDVPSCPAQAAGSYVFSNSEFEHVRTDFVET